MDTCLQHCTLMYKKNRKNSRKLGGNEMKCTGMKDKTLPDGRIHLVWKWAVCRSPGEHGSPSPALQHKETACEADNEYNTALWWAREHVLVIRGCEVVSVHELASNADPAHGLINSATWWPLLLLHNTLKPTAGGFKPLYHSNKFSWPPQYISITRKFSSWTHNFNVQHYTSIYYNHRACRLTEDMKCKYTLFIDLFVI